MAYYYPLGVFLSYKLSLSQFKALFYLPNAFWMNQVLNYSHKAPFVFFKDGSWGPPY